MADNNGKNTQIFDEYVSVTAPGPTGPRELTEDAWERERNNGALKRDFKNYAITFSHQDLYYLLKFIEERALRSESYAEVRQAVLFSEMIREQARQQGF